MTTLHGSRYVVAALYHNVITSHGWAPVVVGIVPRRPWASSSGGRLWLWGESFLTCGQPHDLRDPHVEEVAANAPLLLGPFVRTSSRGVQHYATLVEAERNLERLVLYAAKVSGLRSSVIERPLRKREGEGLNPSGGSKWIRRQQYMRARNAVHLAEWAAKGAEWASAGLARLSRRVTVAEQGSGT